MVPHGKTEQAQPMSVVVIGASVTSRDPIEVCATRAFRRTWLHPPRPTLVAKHECSENCTNLRQHSVGYPADSLEAARGSV